MYYLCAMSVRFQLKEPQIDTKDKKNPTGIYLVYRINGFRFVYSTGEKIHPDLWNQSEQRAYKRKGRSDLSAINDYLSKLEVAMSAVGTRIKTNGEQPTKELLREELEIELGLASRAGPLNFTKFTQEYIDRKKRVGQHHKGINTTLNLILEYNKDLDFEDINVQFYNDFLEWLKKKEFSKNYIGKTLGNIKQIMNEALEAGLTENMGHKSIKFKRMKESVNNIYLTIEELETLHAHDFSATPYLDNACDLFLIGCFTGLRFGDYSQLGRVNFNGGDFIIQDTMKVDGRIIIPQHWIVKEILAKRGGELPHPISNQKLNKYLKKIGEEAKINKEVIRIRTVGMVKKRSVHKKYKLIMTHTARRSLATNMYLAGIPIKTIMKITGHKTVVQLMDYIKITEQEIAESLVDHPFFTRHSEKTESKEESS